jgi:undecaprenyl-diphosphatase
MTAPGPSDTVADALARRVPARRRGPAGLGLAEGLRELGAVDRAVYEAVARTPTGALDGPVRRLSGAADKSRVWLAIAAVIAATGGRRGRRAALEGVAAIAVTSATVNLVLKPIGRHLPLLTVPIRLLAVAVAYSRVHTGVHYPGDVVIGSVAGAGTAAMVAAVADRAARARASGRGG